MLGPGTLYFGSEHVGEIRELSVTTDICEEPITPVVTIPKEHTFEGTCYINRNCLLRFLYGLRLSNNYLKLHGGVMYRNKAYKKVKRKRN